VDLHEEVSAIREDVAYIRAKIEVIPDHEGRLRSLERFRYAFPSTAIIAAAVAVASLVVAVH
jgi:hypothetical protein